jgi:hypothetical protein
MSWRRRDRVVVMGAVVIMWWLDLQPPVQSEPITTKFVDSTPAHVELYSRQYYVIMCVRYPGFIH